ncbi:hypothetical protein [Bradyrhizobium sp. CIR3A]|uniref:hypothetical protein n=1 Tax=Bradyrhizobium sp. CIR3A TaxID=2663838 RepID=UPI001795916F|nr:hypothetical protein [Bradyrhizobium sp. CIR3A]MBB4264354.1 NADPH:quinone reductase-like Zn-dependent oxidoreductase [Bradyrhizobium sp. CIR3A]
MLDYPCPAAFAKRLMLPVSAWSDAVIVPWLTAQGYQFVDKLGEKVSALKGGDRVFGSVPRGGLAEEVAVPAYEPEPPFSKSLTSLKLSDNGTNAGDVPIAVELRRADVAGTNDYAALVTWATGLIVMRSW